MSRRPLNEALDGNFTLVRLVIDIRLFLLGTSQFHEMIPFRVAVYKTTLTHPLQT
jgi:hypothetical protein